MKYLFLFFLIVLYNSQAYEIDKIMTDDSLEKIADRNFLRVKMKYSNIDDYARDIKKWNTKIKNWNPPPADELIYIDFPYTPYLSGATWTPKIGKDESHDEFGKLLSLSAFYSATFGNYSENTINQTVKSGQNFPVTFGLGFSKGDDEKVHFAVSSIYWAPSAKGIVQGNNNSPNSSIQLPGEIGGNIYYQYMTKQRNFGIYSGYDFEKLNTFNTDKIIAGSSVENISNQIHYATLGLVKGFSIFDLKMNLKTSFSKVLVSSTSGEKALSGFKYIVYLTYKPDGRLTYNTFYKHHELSGSTDLTINRVGFSIGFIFL